MNTAINVKTYFGFKLLLEAISVRKKTASFRNDSACGMVPKATVINMVDGKKRVQAALCM